MSSDSQQPAAGSGAGKVFSVFSLALPFYFTNKNMVAEQSEKIFDTEVGKIYTITQRMIDS